MSAYAEYWGVSTGLIMAHAASCIRFHLLPPRVDPHNLWTHVDDDLVAYDGQGIIDLVATHWMSAYAEC
jgi:hypothetical protein